MMVTLTADYPNYTVEYKGYRVCFFMSKRKLTDDYGNELYRLAPRAGLEDLATMNFWPNPESFFLPKATIIKEGWGPFGQYYSQHVPKNQAEYLDQILAKIKYNIDARTKEEDKHKEAFVWGVLGQFKKLDNVDEVCENETPTERNFQ
jgi:hypothetical protein